MALHRDVSSVVSAVPPAGHAPAAVAHLTRRSATRLALGAGALAAGPAPRFGVPVGVAGAAPLPLPRLASVSPAANLGVNEAFRAPVFGLAGGAGWTRWTAQWFNLQPQPGELNPFYFSDQGHNVLEETVRAGMKVAAMILGTPEWAAAVPGLKTGTSVPRGLYEPVFVGAEPNPANTWGDFIFRFASTYKGLIDVYEIWNEPEIPTVGSNALYHTWGGTPADYFQLLKVAARAANPNARIVTAPYAYFRDKQEASGVTLPWFNAFADALKADPQGAGVFDVFSLNLYRNAHDLWDRFHGGAPQAAEAADSIGFRARLAAIGAADKPIWVTETNSMPYDDPVPGWSPQEHFDYFRITLDEQASFVLQAYALGFTAGYEKIFWQSLQDDPYPVPDELWGLIRYDGSRDNADPARVRPAYTAYQVAAAYMGDADWSRLLVKTRPDPQDLRRYASRFDWAGHLAVFQKGDRRTHVLWNGTGVPLVATVQSWGAAAKVVDKYGQETPLAPSASGALTVTLEPATRHFSHPVFGQDPPDYYYIGGSPLVVVVDGVPPDAPVEAPGFVPAI